MSHFKQGHKDGALTPQDWWPHERRKSGRRHAQREDLVRTPGGDSHLHAQEGGPRGTSPAHSCIWDSSLQDWRCERPRDVVRAALGD